MFAAELTPAPGPPLKLGAGSGNREPYLPHGDSLRLPGQG